MENDKRDAEQPRKDTEQLNTDTNVLQILHCAIIH